METLGKTEPSMAERAPNVFNNMESSIAVREPAERYKEGRKGRKCFI